MKSILLFLFIACYSSSFAQDTISAAEIKSRKEASLRMMAPHGYLTLFLGEDLNDATVPLQFFMDERMSMTISDKPGTYKITKLKSGLSNIRIVFSDKISYSSSKKIVLDITAADVDKGSVIKTCVFTGDTKRLIDFFVRYWNTTVNINDGNSNVVAVRNMPGEKAVLTANNGIVKIKIEKL